MYEKLNRKIDELFQNAPRTHRARELKEELLANLIDKYNDLIASGKNEEDAYNIAVSSIGDVDELIRGLKINDNYSYEEIQKSSKKNALFLSISVALYILSVVILILCTAVFNVDGSIAVCLMLTIDAVATGLIIYNATSRPKYLKADDTIVEDFKEWKSSNNQRNEILKSIKSILWTVITAVYLVISFVYGIWGYSWIIFIVGAALEKAITLAFQLKEQ